MALSSSYLRFVIIIAFLSISTISASRPCKIFVISSNSLSITPENPNLKSDFTIFTIRHLSTHHIVPFFLNLRNGILPSSVENLQIQRLDEDQFLFVFEKTNSFRDLAIDIFTFIAAVFFGVGCGILTGATLYLVWVLIVNLHVKNYESNAVSLKKLGYVKITTPMKETA